VRRVLRQRVRPQWRVQALLDDLWRLWSDVYQWRHLHLMASLKVGPQDDFWKRMTFALMAILLAGVGYLYQHQESRLTTMEGEYAALRDAIMRNTVAVAALTATLEAGR